MLTMQGGFRCTYKKGLSCAEEDGPFNGADTIIDKYFNNALRVIAIFTKTNDYIMFDNHQSTITPSR